MLSDVFRESAMPPPVFFMLREIVREPGITVSELARRVALVKSYVSRSVDLLVHRGYVRKEPDPLDQRLIRLYATPAAGPAGAAPTGSCVRPGRTWWRACPRRTWPPWNRGCASCCRNTAKPAHRRRGKV